MSIDDRIARLTERHEALAQSVELLVVQVVSVSESVADVGKRVDSLRITVADVSKTVDILAQSVHDLVGIVRSHETRINRLEGQS